MKAETALMFNSCSTVSLFLSEAVKSIDKHLGKGYAEKHPELVAAFIRTAAYEFRTGQRYKFKTARYLEDALSHRSP